MAKFEKFTTLCFSMEDLLDDNRELPGDFLHELYKWALECKLLQNTSVAVPGCA